MRKQVKSDCDLLVIKSELAESGLDHNSAAGHFPFKYDILFYFESQNNGEQGN